MSTQQLAAASGVEVRLIRALLKADIACGRIRISLDARRHGVYELCPAYDEELRAQLAAARRLLTRHGFRVSTASEAVRRGSRNDR